MTRPVRVAFLQAWLTTGGAERVVDTIVRALDRTRFDCRLLHLYQPGAIGERLARDGWPTTSALGRTRLDPFVGSRLAQWYAREGIEVVHVFDSALPMFWAGMVRRLGSRPALVLGVHSTERREDRLQHALANAATLPVADCIVALSAAHRDLLVERHRLDPARIELIPTGVDLDRFRPPLNRGACRRALGLPEDGFAVGLVAALRPEKQLDVFVSAAMRLLERQPQVRFVVAGSGPESERLRTAVNASGRASAFRLLGPREDIPTVWGAMDAAILTSRTEALPVSLIEAHACGVPAVSTDVGSVREIIREGETGWLVPSGDAAGLAERLERWVVDPALNQRMGAAARQHAVAQFGIERMALRFGALFERMATRSRVEAAR